MRSLWRKDVNKKVVVIGLMVFLSLVYLSHINRLNFGNIVGKEKKVRYVVDTSGCRIPDFDPFDRSIIKFINLTDSIICKGKPSLTYEDGHTLRINVTAKKIGYGDFKKCSYKSISRGPQLNDLIFEWGKEIEFASDVMINDEFLMARCWNSTGHEIYKNFHTFVLLVNDAIHDKKNAAFRKEFSAKENLNVLMIGVDSISRLNFMRQMPKTRRYLLNEMAAIELEGYTKVADNTFVNIVPLTTGKFLKDLPWNETMSNLPMDPYGFIWKNFSNSGYRTLYAEDAPKMATFNLMKKGFHEAPTDHYLRAFNMALEKEMPAKNAIHHCVGERLETDIVLNFLKQFATTYQGKPHFGYALLSRLTHEHVNYSGHADESFYRNLKQLKDNQLLDNTVLIFFSDHGSRMGELRTTYIGKFEERMPIMFFVFPNWFKQKYPILYRKLNINKNRLTTPFDIHATLLDLLYFQGTSHKIDKTMRGLSLFSEIPDNRTCEEASILPHWCTCMKMESLSIDSELVNSTATVIMSEINRRLSKDTDKCAVLTLKQIISATKLTANNNVLRFKDARYKDSDKTIVYGPRTQAILTIKVIIVTSPGGARFEATVTHDESTNEHELAGDISRINKYGDQPHCINNYALRKYCYCLN